jgi:transposase
MKKIITVAARKIEEVEGQKLTIGLDLGDRSSWYCVLDEAGEVLLEQKLAATPKAMKEVFRDAAQPDRAGNRDALAVGEPAVE